MVEIVSLVWLHFNEADMFEAQKEAKPQENNEASPSCVVQRGIAACVTVRGGLSSVLTQIQHSAFRSLAALFTVKRPSRENRAAQVWFIARPASESGWGLNVRCECHGFPSL